MPLITLRVRASTSTGVFYNNTVQTDFLAGNKTVKRSDHDAMCLCRGKGQKAALMKIVVIGRSGFGKDVLTRLVTGGENVVGVIAPPPQYPGSKADPLAVSATGYSLPVCTTKSFKSGTVYHAYRNMKPDLTVLAFVTQILPKWFLEFPEHGSICFHPSLLPRHRGANAVGWAILNGETSTGLTIFWPDEGIDTGPILLQRQVPIGDNDTVGSLLISRLFPMGVEAIAEAVSLIKNGDPPRLIQDEILASYEPPIDDSVSQIDWNTPTVEIFNKIRACDPQPGAWTVSAGQKIRLYASKKLKMPEFPSHRNGTIVDINDEGVFVKTQNGILVIGKIRNNEGKKMKALAFATECKMKVGDCFTGLE